MKSFLEHFAAILGTASVVFLILSVSHEWGYFFTIGSDFQSLLTTSDYISNGVVWLPASAFTVLGWIDWDKLKENREKKKFEWKNWKAWIWPAIVFLCFAEAILLTRWPPLGFGQVQFLIMFVWVWSRAWRAFYRVIPGLDDELNTFFRHVVRLGIPLIAGVFVWGSIGASIDLSRTSDPYIFLVHDKPEKELRFVLRNLEKGVLVRNPETERIEFLKWDDVNSISKPEWRQSESFVCRYWQIICPKDALPLSPL